MPSIVSLFLKNVFVRYQAYIIIQIWLKQFKELVIGVSKVKIAKIDISS
jgi:hypothetical protein